MDHHVARVERRTAGYLHRPDGVDGTEPQSTAGGEQGRRIPLGVEQHRVGAPDQADIPVAWKATAVAEIVPGAKRDSSGPPKRRAHGGALPR